MALQQSAIGINNLPRTPIPVEEASPSLQLALFTLSCEEGRGNSGSSVSPRALREFPHPTPSGRDFRAFLLLCHAGAASTGGRLLCHQLPAGGCCGCGARERHPALQPGGGWVVVFVPPWHQVLSKCFWTTSGWCRMGASARDHPQMRGRTGQLEGPEPETVRKSPRLPLGAAGAGGLVRDASMQLIHHYSPSASWSDVLLGPESPWEKALLQVWPRMGCCYTGRPATSPPPI